MPMRVIIILDAYRTIQSFSYTKNLAAEVEGVEERQNFD